MKMNANKIKKSWTWREGKEIVVSFATSDRDQVMKSPTRVAKKCIKKIIKVAIELYY